MEDVDLEDLLENAFQRQRDGSPQNLGGFDGLDGGGPVNDERHEDDEPLASILTGPAIPESRSTFTASEASPHTHLDRSYRSELSDDNALEGIFGTLQYLGPTPSITAHPIPRLPSDAEDFLTSASASPSPQPESLGLADVKHPTTERLSRKQRAQLKRPAPDPAGNAAKRAQRAAHTLYQETKRTTARAAKSTQVTKNYQPPQKSATKYSKPTRIQVQVDAEMLPAARGAYVGAGRVPSPELPVEEQRLENYPDLIVHEWDGE